ncbi:MAG: universal stress protein [Methanosarcinales archaeon]|jgi:nucleotide-binding universal stress UspA family protein|nr:universal stress protein [Methanosarcinales archaeon]
MTGSLYNTIVVGVDGTKYIRKAVNTAVGLAKLTGAKLYAVYVSDASYVVPINGEWELISDKLQIEAEAAFEFVRDRAGAEGIDFETVSLSGAPAQEIVQYADLVGADLIVVGAAGKKAIERLILGSVSEKVVRSSKQQVLVVRCNAAEPDK